MKNMLKIVLLIFKTHNLIKVLFTCLTLTKKMAAQPQLIPYLAPLIHILLLVLIYIIIIKLNTLYFLN